MTVKPESVGMSSTQLTHIDSFLKPNYVDKQKIAGCLTLVARRGEIVHLSPLGLMDIGRNIPMREDTLFRIYSMSKPITSVALMTLYEKGLFQLSDPVHKFIPQWRNLRVFASGVHPNFITAPLKRPMTVRDLMTHQSGLTYGFMNRSNVDHAYRKLKIGERHSTTLKETVEQLAHVPLEFSPGDYWNYSISTDILGYLVEVMSGMPFDQYLKTRIFDPLKMTDTGFDVPAHQKERLAACYQRGLDKKLHVQDDPENSPYLKPAVFFSGGGGLVSTAHDYFKFCQMLLNGGELDGARILGRKTLQLMTLNHLPHGKDIKESSFGSFSEIPMEGSGFGLGFSVIQDQAKSQQIGDTGEFAWGGAASTIFWINPKEQLLVIFMTQLMPSATFDFRGQLKNIIYPAIMD
ncbi:MAG: beta-lactamase family protein [Desulfobacteraceae bacterium]|nr:beta-lactamase family protein [Desulfobacteraceae bacterium]MBU4001179.1 beta-lactamase family protein [Pseudomonadota bacterium]